jgi:hypothetical protein
MFKKGSEVFWKLIDYSVVTTKDDVFGVIDSTPKVEDTSVVVAVTAYRMFKKRKVSYTAYKIAYIKDLCLDTPLNRSLYLPKEMW